MSDGAEEQLTKPEDRVVETTEVEPKRILKRRLGNSAISTVLTFVLEGSQEKRERGRKLWGRKWASRSGKPQTNESKKVYTETHTN